MQLYHHLQECMLEEKLQFKLNEKFFRKLFLFVLIIVGFLIINKAVI